MKYSLYSKEIMKHFKNPKNVGKIKNPSGKGRVGNLACGDIMEFYIKVKKDKNGKERISDIKFQTFGCIVALAVSSILTTMVKGKTLQQAIKINNNDILKKSGPVPPIKIHCSILAADALHEAIYDYLTKNKRIIPESLQKEHERIKNTLEQVERTHKEFTQFEEKILNK
ncbi:MAG: iron-sulfur cluster assembly scaffold protein [Candidatus Aenigmatarchaeota archaeon]